MDILGGNSCAGVTKLTIHAAPTLPSRPAPPGPTGLRAVQPAAHPVVTPLPPVPPVPLPLPSLLLSPLLAVPGPTRHPALPQLLPLIPVPPTPSLPTLVLVSLVSVPLLPSFCKRSMWEVMCVWRVGFGRSRNSAARPWPDQRRGLDTASRIMA